MQNQDTPIVARATNDGLKNFIIGKLWTNSKNGTRPGTLRISRDLPQDIVLTKGTTLYLTTNIKREDKLDADFSISVLLPTATADKLIQMQKEASSQRLALSENQEQPV